ncbi:DUF2537 domain-containing protein [Prauserella oleivorans]|uniref:DUF2537 domain-containing protein n=1 Tax=Prauserella oleivorans TaxID=1478153 RepID=A0ABW5WAX6_9PSEU
MVGVRGAEVELRVRGERAVLAGTENGQEADPYRFALGPELADALHEWARVSAAVQRTGSPEGADVVARRGRQLAGRVADALGVAVSYWDPVADKAFVVPPPPPEPRPAPRQCPGEPTPWATGLLVAAFIAVFALVAMLALAGALASATHGLVAVAAALVVTAGLAPSLWLGRKVPIVRWIVLGAAGGIGLSWIGVLVIAF